MEQEARKMPTKEDAHPAVGKKLAEQLMRYSGHRLGDDAESVAEDIAKALDRCWGSYDGFKIGKALDDDCYWDVDASMIGELDCAVWMVPEVLKEMMTAWIAETGYVIPFAKGDRIVAKWGGSDVQGTVHEIRMDGTILLMRDTGENSFPVVQWKDVRVLAQGIAADTPQAEGRGVEAESPTA